VAGLDLDNFDGGAGTAVTTVATAGTDQSATPGGFDNTGFQVAQSGVAYVVSIASVTAGGSDGAGAGAVSLEAATAAELAAQTDLIEGDNITISVGSVTASYSVRVNDQDADIAAGLRSALIDSGLDPSEFQIESNGGDLEITNNGPLEVRVDVSAARGSGGLASLAGIDISSSGGAATALGTIETVIQTATDAQAALGTVEKRLEIQSDFTSKLIDSFKNGIGALVDADLEEASARLQALQVQQQLGIQALSIANQAPQNILALFR
jgi:flagellin